MAEDPMRAKARATFGKVFMDAAKPQPLAKNAATASQKVANQRPIPTYKVGGVVKKADGGMVAAQPTATRGNQFAQAQQAAEARLAQAKAAQAASAPRLAAMRQPGYRSPLQIKQAETEAALKNRDAMRAASAARGQAATQRAMDEARARAAAAQAAPQVFTRTQNPNGTYGTAIPVARKKGGVVKKADGGKVMSDRIAARMEAGNYKDGGAMYDYKHGGKVQTSSDTARKLATEMGGMKDGGSCGMKPVKRAVGGAGKTRKDMAPIKRKQGGPARGPGGIPKEGVSTPPVAPSGRRATIDDLNKSNRDVGGMSAGQVRAAGEAIGRGNRTPREPIPKKAKGGAAKVRKGMMSQTGDIKQAVKPKKGIGGFM